MSSVMPSGWYYAEGDPPGTHRYWDGETWQGGPQPVVQQPQAFGASYGVMYTEASQATTALVLSLLGFFCCGLLFPVGWKIAHDEIVAIDAGRRDPGNRGTAMVGKVIGITGTVLMVAGLVGWIALAGLAVSS